LLVWSTFALCAAARCTSHSGLEDRSIFVESSSSSSQPAEFALVRRDKVTEVLALASFGRRGVSAAHTALGRARRSRTRHGRNHPRPFRAGLALPTLLRPLTFIVGIPAPAPQLQPRRRLPLLRTRRNGVNSNTQSGTTHARFRSGGARAQNVCCLVRSDDSHRQRASILT
jgi:hypothetical protein